jgi:hypothetical protein
MKDETLTADDVRAMLRRACDSRPSVLAWAIDHGQLPSFVSEMLSGKKPISKRVCSILGVRKVIRFEIDDHEKLR